MWDRPEILMAVANFLYGVAAVALMYILLLTAIHLPVFPVREVQVIGSISRVTRAQIDTVVHRELRGNFFTIQLDTARGAFAKLPWVRRVQVRRHWPDRLEVFLEEHEAIARWGGDELVNTHGEVFAAASDGRLPMFHGPREVAADMAENYRQFSDQLAPLGLRIAEVDVSDRRAWRVRLEEGMTLELGRDQLAGRLGKFVSAYAESVGRMNERPQIVDLRYPNGFAVRMKAMGNGA
jgi:cell division protein FtsQ